jgi:hypothetical protein
MLAGQGLDWQRSGTLLQPAQEVRPSRASDPIPFPAFTRNQAGQLPVQQAPPTPPTPKNYFKVNRAAVRFSGNCDVGSEVVLRCPVSATSDDPGADTQFCGHWLREVPTPTTWVYLVKGKVESDGGFTIGTVDPQVGAFVACSVTDPKKKPTDSEWRILGAVGKCLLWDRGQNRVGWVPKANSSEREFSTCLRAVRADYCGNGVTHTIDGTQIDLYAMNENHQVNPPYFLEATWNETGALCIIHARWLSMSPTCRNRFSHVLGQPPPAPSSDSKSGKGGSGVDPSRHVVPLHAVPSKLRHGSKGSPDGGTADDSWTGTEYHCDPSQVKFLTQTTGCEMDQALMGRALRFGILADDSMLQ